MKKMLIFVTTLMLCFTNAFSEDGPYVGFKPSKLKVEWSTVEGIDLNEVYDDEYDVMDLHLGYNIGNSFIELGYFNSSEEGLSASASAGGITVTGTSSLEMDGFRIGTGYNHQINDNWNIRPFINYYDIDYDASLSLTVTGSATFTAAADASGSESMIDAGLGADYVIDENSKIGFSYAQSIDDIEDTDKVETLAVTASYKF